MTYQCYDKEIGRSLALDLLDIQAIKLSPESPFTWASGWKSPIYCDNRLSLSHPQLRSKIKKLFAGMIGKHFTGVDAIAGVATAGIPQGALVADLLNLPFIYVRSASKSHGLTNQIEGRIDTGSRVVVLEDLISTGGSSLAAVEALRSADMEVAGMVGIFTYGFDIAQQNFEKHDVDLIFLSEYQLLIEAAIQKGYIEEEMLNTLSQWRQNPGTWNS